MSSYEAEFNMMIERLRHEMLKDDPDLRELSDEKQLEVVREYYRGVIRAETLRKYPNFDG